MSALPNSAPTEQPPAAFRGGVRQEISHLAIASLLLSVLGVFTLLLFFVGLLPAVASVICGHLALIKIKLGQGMLRGRAPALLGLIIGYGTVFATPVIAISLAVGYPHLMEYLQQGREETRIDRASELYRACEDYSRDHRGGYPKSWDDLRGRYLNPSELEQLLSRNALALLPFLPEPEKAVNEAVPAYKLVPHDRPIPGPMEGRTIVIQEVAPPAIQRVVVVYDDGRTELESNPYGG